MAIIRNATELSEKQWKDFRSLFIKYLQRKYVDVNHPHLCKIELFLRAYKHESNVMTRIRKGYLTSFVSFDVDTNDSQSDLRPIGFVIGFDTDSGTNNIAHIYMEHSSQLRTRRLDLLDLFGAYVNEIETHGMRRCQMSSSFFDQRLTNDLETLEFEQTEIHRIAADYRLEFKKDQLSLPAAWHRSYGTKK